MKKSISSSVEWCRSSSTATQFMFLLAILMAQLLVLQLVHGIFNGQVYPSYLNEEEFGSIVHLIQWLFIPLIEVWLFLWLLHFFLYKYIGFLLLPLSGILFLLFNFNASIWTGLEYFLVGNILMWGLCCWSSGKNAVKRLYLVYFLYKSFSIFLSYMLLS